MGTFSRAFRLLGASWQVLREDKRLMLLPLMSMAAVLVAAIPFVIAIAGIDAGRTASSFTNQLTPVSYLLFGLFYLVVYSIGIFFNAALVGAATLRLQGGRPSLSDGLNMAAAKLPKIIGWAAVAATVGVVLRAAERRVPLLGRIAIALIGAAWGMVTFFVVPVLLFEEVGVFASVKRSAGIFRERWGEQFVGNGSIGLAMLVLMLAPILVGVALMAAGLVAVGVAVLVVSIALLLLAASALTGIFNAALYRYATTGQLIGPFGGDDLASAFRARPGRRSGGVGYNRGGFSGGGF